MPRLVICRFDVRLQGRIEVHVIEHVYRVVLEIQFAPHVIIEGGCVRRADRRHARVEFRPVTGARINAGEAVARADRVGENSKASDSSVESNKLASSDYMNCGLWRAARIIFTFRKTDFK